MTFKINTIYDFNLVIDGVVIGIKARYTGAGETIGNTLHEFLKMELMDTPSSGPKPLPLLTSLRYGKKNGQSFSQGGAFPLLMNDICVVCVLP